MEFIGCSVDVSVAVVAAASDSGALCRLQLPFELLLLRFLQLPLQLLLAASLRLVDWTIGEGQVFFCTAVGSESKRTGADNKFMVRFVVWHIHIKYCFFCFFCF